MSTAVEQKLSGLETDLKDFINKHLGRSKEFDSRLRIIEQSLVSRPGIGGFAGGLEKSIGQKIVESEGFAALRRGGRSTGQIEVGSLKASTIVSGTWTAGPDFRPAVAGPAMPTLPLRSLIPSFATESNMVEYARETSATDGADYQVTEGSDKPQSDLGFTLIQAPVATLATWIAASRQAIDDSPALAGYINTRVLYFVERKIETEILFGSGASGHLLGIATQATAASPGSFTNLVDAVAAAASQLAAVGVAPDGAVVNPQDFWAARQVKASGSGEYLMGDPQNPAPPNLWNLALSVSLSMPRGKYLVGAFQTQSAIADRQQATVELSREHADFFTKNLVAVLCEERLAVLTFRPEAFVYGQLSGVGS